MTNLVLLVADMWVLGGLVLLLHYVTPRVGFAPLLLTVGALTVFIQGQKNIYIQPAQGFILFINSNVLVPVVLLSVLVLYVTNGAVPARMTILCIVGLSLLGLAVQFIYRMHLAVEGGGTTTGLPPDVLLPPLNPRINWASLLAFAADMFAIAIFYQGVKNVLPRLPEAIAVGVALLAGLWTDALVFGIAARLGTPDFMTFLPGDVVGKTVSALLLWPMAAVYLTSVAPRMEGYIGGKDRPLFDVLFGSFEDIKLALVRTEKALEESEAERSQQAANFHEVAENIEEALWLAAPDASPFFVNRAYSVIWGRSVTSIYADPDTFANSIHPEDRERILGGLSLIKLGNYDVEFRIVRPDGGIRWVRERAFPIKDKDGVIYRVAGITEDITERKLIEQDRLELTVEREKVRFMRDFISEFSHDLKTPLTAINLKVYHLSRTDDPDRRRVHLDELAQQSNRMGELIDDLLTLTRLESSVEIPRTRADINRMIGDICAALHPQMEHKQLTLTLDLDPNAPFVEVAPDDLSRVLSNLIDNAVHYTPAGGTVRVQTQMSGQEVLIRVSDTGIGIPADDQPRIFERFFRASNARSTNSNGTGLGLAIVKKIVEGHHGRIELDSTVGEGTTFTIHLPLDPEA
jgi:PAS domain S-box-containing protein